MTVVADQRRRPEQRDEVRRVVLGPAAIDVDRRQPRDDAVVEHRLQPEQHAEHPGDRAPPRDPRRRDASRPPTSSGGASPSQTASDPSPASGDDREREPPIAAVTGQRHRDCGRDRRAEHEPDRVGAGPQRRPGRHLVAHDEREDRPRETHPEPDPERQRSTRADPDAEPQQPEPMTSPRRRPAPSAPRPAAPARARAARRCPCTGRGSSQRPATRARCRARSGCSAAAGRWR